MAIEKVKPFDSPYEGLGCFKYFFNILNKLQFWSGLVPIKVDKNRSTVEFKLISTSTLLASLRLLLLTFPLIVLPLILHSCGLHKKEYETATGKNYTSLYDDAYLIFVIFLHKQNFWRIKFTPKNANFSR